MLPDCPDRAAAERRLRELRERFPLPAGCSHADPFLDRTQVGELELGMVGLAAQLPGAQSATGAAASSGGGLPVERAFFELLERVAILLVPRRGGALALRDRSGRRIGSRPAARVYPREAEPRAGASRLRDSQPRAGAAWRRESQPRLRARTSRSNGVALHTSWTAACASAQHELIERDHVLRSFAGEFAPQPCAYLDDSIAQALRAHYGLEAYRIEAPCEPSAAAVRGVFLFPRAPEAPLVYGFAAAESGEAALAGAQREALQRLAFLWGEALPERAPEPAPTPDYHQDYYLYPPHHAQLRAWLSGMHGASAPRMAAAYAGADTSFVDLTPEEWSTTLAIARARSPHARALRFGAAHSGARARPPHPVT